jgi:DNA-binding NtrC family response regulator
LKITTSRKAAAMDAFKKLAGLKTLLIDDNEIIRDTLTMVFAYKKCAIKAVATAEEGLATLRRERFDIIICDFGLPGINGAEFFRRVMASYPNTVKVLISGFAREDEVVEALEMGVGAFIKKPFSLIVLLEQLTPLVDKYQAANRNHRHPQEKKTTLKIKKKLKSQRAKNPALEDKTLLSSPRSGLGRQITYGIME